MFFRGTGFTFLFHDGKVLRQERGLEENWIAEFSCVVMNNQSYLTVHRKRLSSFPKFSFFSGVAARAANFSHRGISFNNWDVRSLRLSD